MVTASTTTSQDHDLTCNETPAFRMIVSISAYRVAHGVEARNVCPSTLSLKGQRRLIF